MADWTAEHLAIRDMINENGSSCRIDKVDGTSASTVGVLLSSQGATLPGTFVEKKERKCFVSGAISVVPKAGDTVTFKPNTYIIKSVKAIAIGEGKKNVFAYKLMVGT